MTRICILGGGFGGLYTALELCQLPWQTPPTITLVDRHERFVFLPLLYELLTGEMEDWQVAPRYVDLIAEVQAQKSVKLKFCQDTVETIDLDGHQVKLGSGQTLDYDYLTLALGSETPLHQVPGAADHAIPFRQLADVYRLRQALDRWEQATQTTGIPAHIAIVGAGASGVELACKLSDRLGSQGEIHLIERGSEILGGFSAASTAAARQALEQRGIPVELNSEVTEIGPDRIQWQRHQPQGSDHLPTPEMLSVNGVLWTAGTQPIPLIQALDLSRDERNRIQIKPTLQTQDRPDVFALGDLAAVVDATGERIPATAQAAFQQAGYCAWNIWALATAERPLLPFRYEPLGEMLSLGVDTAVLSSMGLTLTGAWGYLARRTVYLARMPTLEHQIRVGWSWITRPLSDWPNWLQTVGDRGS
ncbi:MAG: NAD(P)/FAD-dependent oxidoreductase [Synechococcaceae cyanobacterium RM1_1_27]|nr:NAD(P)/FAD-dependent oxidoreductase [Synechococcaceae cyanobacterium RM1_1_27]